jgi:hypothetical protein
VKIRASDIILGVIIVVFLLGLLVPAIHGPGGMSAEYAKSQQKVVSLATALRAYWIEYGEIPRGDAANMLRVLEARNNDGQNPRKIIFIEFRPAVKRLFWEVRKGDRDNEGLYLDGWGRPFIIQFSADRRQVTIKSYGRNGKDDGGKGDDIVEVVTPPTAK